MAQPAFTFGVSGGMTQAESEQSQDPDGKLGLLLRASGQRLGFELAIDKVSRPNNDAAKSFTGLAVLDLGPSRRWVPQLFAGAGIDRSSGDQSYQGEHVEVGAGLELRLDGGLVLGARFHVGNRWTSSQTYYAYGATACCGGDFYSNEPSEGQYRTLDAYAGLRF